MRPEDSLAWAIRVGDGLLQRAIVVKGVPTWPARQKPDAPLVEGWDMWNGAAGIGFFLSLLGQATGLDRFTVVGDAVLARSIARARRDPGAKEMMSAAGLGQALLIRGRVDEAQRIGRRLLPIRSDESFNLLEGSAGIGTFLLSLHRSTGEEAFLAAAYQRGERLLRVPAPWFSGTQRYLGYSHGPAGIGEYFLRVYAETGDARFRRAAQACARLIDRYSTESEGVIETMRTMDTDDVMCAWCHGSAGILLFELAGAQILGGPAWRRRAKLRAAATRRFVERAGASSLLCYCHGVAGNLDMLIEYGARDDAMRLAIQHLLPRGGGGAVLRFPGQFGPWPHPSLFLGDAGIGFFFLRLADPSIPLFYRVL